MMEKNDQTIEQIAARIVAYYRQIIEIKKSQGVKTFVIDSIKKGDTLSLLRLEDKYDGRSRWRTEGLEIGDSENWSTLPCSFRTAFGEDTNFYVSSEALFQKISLMLSKEGVANYFDTHADDGNNYFKKGDNCLYIVIA